MAAGAVFFGAMHNPQHDSQLQSPLQHWARHQQAGMQSQSTHRAVLANEHIPANRGAVSVWTHVKRNGDWIMARTFRAVAVMGGVELDLRDAKLGEGVSSIELVAFWGGIEILVPDDVFLDCDVDALAAGVEVVRTVPTNAPPGAPTVRITGTVLMGGVEVKVVPRSGSAR
jgi:hypothetical protein